MCFKLLASKVSWYIAVIFEQDFYEPDGSRGVHWLDVIGFVGLNIVVWECSGARKGDQQC